MNQLLGDSFYSNSLAKRKLLHRVQQILKIYDLCPVKFCSFLNAIKLQILIVAQKLSHHQFKPNENYRKQLIRDVNSQMILLLLACRF